QIDRVFQPRALLPIWAHEITGLNESFRTCGYNFVSRFFESFLLARDENNCREISRKTHGCRFSNPLTRASHNRDSFRTHRFILLRLELTMGEDFASLLPESRHPLHRPRYTSGCGRPHANGSLRPFAWPEIFAFWD